MLARSKPTPPPPAEEFAAARDAWDLARANWQALAEKTEAIVNAVALVDSGKNRQESHAPHKIWAAAEPYLEAARHRRVRLLEQLDDLRLQLKNSAPDFALANEAFAAAQRREADRLALEKQPEHRKAARRLIAAVEELSRAVAAEREFHDAFRRTSPVPESRFLPRLSDGFSTVDEDGPLRQFAQRVRVLGI